ncbi:MAG TPA: GIY-YIG nuclease family protein [Candidatus Egerieimonas intestinavium]|uniref:GIY-YIG nuclease family protein n=1 Tax=Candidatus Egerieimonas intestinavium TaxID=2840777 RepID=A0A9D1EHT0_9FIRM|nr:GIY-YIG nuclease family protein [Candidatus Egerieimonas intestinavium]
MNYTYMLQCADGSFYTGWTNNLEKRVREHNAGRGGKYTRAHRPVQLCYWETFSTKEEAMRREWEIKQLSRREKCLLAKRGTKDELQKTEVL